MIASIHYCPVCRMVMALLWHIKNIIKPILETTMKLLTRRSVLRRLCAVPAVALTGSSR